LHPGRFRNALARLKPVCSDKAPWGSPEADSRSDIDTSRVTTFAEAKIRSLDA